MFMFMRWLPLLKSKLGIERVGLMIFAPLADFCDWSALGVDEVYKVGLDKIPFGKWEYSCSIMSMPAVFGAQRWSDIPDDNAAGSTIDVYEARQRQVVPSGSASAGAPKRTRRLSGPRACRSKWRRELVALLEDKASSTLSRTAHWKSTLSPRNAKTCTTPTRSSTRTASLSNSSTCASGATRRRTCAAWILS